MKYTVKERLMDDLEENLKLKKSFIRDLNNAIRSSRTEKLRPIAELFEE